MSKTLLSIFDYSGAWSHPFARNGWSVIQWDIKIDHFMDINQVGSVETALDLFEHVDAIIAAPPCTEFTTACNRLWDMKDADGRTAAATQLVHQTMKLVNLFSPTDMEYDGTFFWAMENPVGRLPKLVPEVGKPWYFDPCDFAGWLPANNKRLRRSRLDEIRAKNGKGVTREEANLVIEANAYTKKTGIWGDFRRPEKRRIEPVRCAIQGSFTQRLGGTSAKTKEERSNTPAGFAEAFYQANHDYVGNWAETYMQNWGGTSQEEEGDE